MKEDLKEQFAQRVRSNQRKLSSNLKRRFDYIVCGAGTSGSVVAGRLAADLKTQVLLLEAGGTDERELSINPNSWPMTLATELDWGFVAESNPHLNGREIPYSMGKMLGVVPFFTTGVTRPDQCDARALRNSTCSCWSRSPSFDLTIL